MRFIRSYMNVIGCGDGCASWGGCMFGGVGG